MNNLFGRFSWHGGALTIAAGVLAVGLLASMPANANPFAFGASFNDGNETLTLATTGGPVVINTNGYQGWISGAQSNSAGNTNYFTGDINGDGSVLLNNFFAFQLTGQGLTAGSVTGATLSVTQFYTTDPLTYSLGDATALADSGALDILNGPSVPLYNALGVGGFGTFALSPGYTSDLLSFNLNSAAVAAINADLDSGSQYFALGGTVSGVPEPSAWTMLLMGMAGLGAAVRGRRRPALTA